jgi:hypothetical protein
MMTTMRTSMAATKIPKIVKNAAFEACAKAMGATDILFSG